MVLEGTGAIRIFEYRSKGVSFVGGEGLEQFKIDRLDGGLYEQNIFSNCWIFGFVGFVFKRKAKGRVMVKAAKGLNIGFLG